MSFQIRNDHNLKLSCVATENYGDCHRQQCCTSSAVTDWVGSKGKQPHGAVWDTEVNIIAKKQYTHNIPLIKQHS